MSPIIPVLITSGSSQMAVSAIKCLNLSKLVQVYVVDGDISCPGIHLADNYRIVKSFEQEHRIVEETIKICQEENIPVVIPGLHPHIEIFSRNLEIFEKLGIQVIVSTYDAIMCTIDKLVAHRKLKDSIPFAKTYTYNQVCECSSSIKYPIIMKPRNGCGSVNILYINSSRDFEYYTSKFTGKLDKYIFQEYIEGREFTVDILCDKNGNCISTVPRVRTQIQNGVTYRGKTIDHQILKEIGHKLAKSIQFFGPINYQAIEESHSKEVKIIEINPRISGTIILTAEAGVNMPLLAIKIALGLEIDTDELKFQPETQIIRYWEERFLFPS
ncbi:ATP-grasp domain-containing protein [Methanoculleus sp. FWC-SCC1]|uniref:ATP-grasp domain-containing protein n=1 Tax=Methanoculleus frigidifontis TaxID=2584085 RepID=A0ABT8ME96_9EURY|nr:ATP-grasp domain-containing protein [Methanoculleus sp. FWC-SCC1]MDN7026234.1 ATP-grasp domain-containing protein [Methanoculleus sp. FWC-SCC1]